MIGKVIRYFLVSILFAISAIFFLFYIGISVDIVPLYIMMAAWLSPTISYYLAYKNNIHHYYLDAFYTIALIVPWLIAEASMGDKYVDICDDESHPDLLFFSLFFALPFIFAIRGIVHYYKPELLNSESNKLAKRYFSIATALLPLSVLVFGAIGGIAHGCQDS